MMTKTVIKSTAFMLLASSNFLYGSEEKVGTLTQLEGDVKILSNPTDKIDESSAAENASQGTLVKYEGKFYRTRTAKIGDRLENGNILRTTPSGKTRVIYDNGDQFHVGPATAFKISWDGKKEKAPTVAMMYGKFRGVIEKEGPRTKMFVRTKSATMGVRGTDFFVADQGLTGAAEISVVRGSVEVKPETPKAKPVEVKAGFSVDVAPPPPVVKTAENKPGAKQPEAAPAPVIEFRKTTQEDLKAIQKTSEIKPAASPEKVAELPKEVKEKLEKLEKKAVETTLKDIKTYDPKMYAQISAQKVQNIDQIQGSVVEKLIETAPKAPEVRKPFKSEIENLENGAYDTYFKEI